MVVARLHPSTRKLLQPTTELIAAQTEYAEVLLTGWRTAHEFDGRPAVQDASSLTRDGISCVVYGLVGLARECFAFALPKLMHDLGPEGPKETAQTFVPVQPQPQLPELEGYQLTGGTFTWGWSASTQANWWVCVALCRWFLQGVDDRESLSKACDCLHQYHSNPANADGAEQLLDLNSICPVFVAAGEDGRCLEHLRSTRGFRPPVKTTSVTSSRGMSYVLATHRLENMWVDKDMENGWSKFLKSQILKTLLVTYGTSMEEVTLWMKMRYWDSAPEPRPDPYEVFMRLYDHLPDIVPPPIVR